MSLGGRSIELWIHNICPACWTEQEGPKGRRLRLPVPKHGPDDVCCWCGEPNAYGIYKRANPEVTPCKGKHK
jgi:hypothetical protein